MRGLGIQGKVHVRHRDAEVWGLAARRMAGLMIDNTPPPPRGLLYVLQLGKWVRLKAVAEPIRKAPAIVVGEYRWGLYLRDDGLRAETGQVRAAEAVRVLGLSPRVRKGSRHA